MHPRAKVPGMVRYMGLRDGEMRIAGAHMGRDNRHSGSLRAQSMGERNVAVVCRCDAGALYRAPHRSHTKQCPCQTDSEIGKCKVLLPNHFRVRRGLAVHPRPSSCRIDSAGAAPCLQSYCYSATIKTIDGAGRPIRPRSEQGLCGSAPTHGLRVRTRLASTRGQPQRSRPPRT